MGNKYPEHVLKVLRQRIGDYDDELNTELDERCNQLSPRQAMRHLVTWQLGSSDWFDWFEEKLSNVGLKIVEAD